MDDQVSEGEGIPKEEVILLCTYFVLPLYINQDVFSTCTNLLILFFYFCQNAQTGGGAQADGDPELLDDSDFYQQLLKEFFETVDPTSSGKNIVDSCVLALGMELDSICFQCRSFPVTHYNQLTQGNLIYLA